MNASSQKHFGKFVDPHFLKFKQLGRAIFPKFEGLNFLTNDFLTSAIGVLVLGLGLGPGPPRPGTATAPALGPAKGSPQPRPRLGPVPSASPGCL